MPQLRIALRREPGEIDRNGPAARLRAFRLLAEKLAPDFIERPQKTERILRISEPARAIAPAFGFIAGPEVPTLWGLVYAAMAFGIGVVYDRAFLVAAVVIFAGAVVAIAWPAGNGYVLGPTMGLGMIVPGWRAERRVRTGAGA